jgi:hypothetical protein
MSDIVEAGTKTIDVAWRQAEDRLGEYWAVRSLIRVKGEGWEAVAAEQMNRHVRIGQGRTPTEALDDLR